MYYIYKIENLVNHKIYIGLTNNIGRRKSRHFTDLRNNRHDNSFLQKEFNIYGEKNFSFNIEYQGNISAEEISEKEKFFIKKYDSYKNGYNQNEGGNFGPSNGGTHLTENDILNILSALEFCNRPGGTLSEIFGISLTTISRIKQGINHCQYKEEYEKMSLEERKKIYKNFCNYYNFSDKKIKKSNIEKIRKLSEEQVHLILCNFEFHIISQEKMIKIVGIKSRNTLTCIKDGRTYKDYSNSYKKLNNAEKQKLVTLLSNQ